jgi:uncharacterized protein
MESADVIAVQVVYAASTRQVAKTLTLPAGSSVEQAIFASGLLEAFPEIDLARQRVGVFGELVRLDDCLQGGERVEIYRPLLADPKETRRRRAKAKRGR